MKVLFVTTDNFPNCGACASLLVNLFGTEALRQKISQIDVLTLLYTQQDARTETINGVTVYRAKTAAFISMAELKKNMIRHPMDYIGGTAQKIYQKLSRRFKKKSVFWKKNVADCLYRKLVEMKAAQRYDVIVAMSGAYEAAAAVMDYRNKHDCRFVFYQVDPCSSNAMYGKRTAIQRQNFEKEIYQMADGVITTPILYREKIGVYEDILLEKVCQMEFPNVEPENYQFDEKRDDSHVRCVYAGRIYRRIRDPRYACALFGSLSPEIELHLIGVSREELNFFLDGQPIPKNVICHGLCLLKETQRQIAQADILVNIGNEMHNQVPSKLFEYISAGKPILNLCVNADCPTLPYLQKHPFALSILTTEVSVEKAAAEVETFLRKNKGSVMGKMEICRIYKTCTAEYCGEQMAQVLEKAINNGENYGGENGYSGHQ